MQTLICLFAAVVGAAVALCKIILQGVATLTATAVSTAHKHRPAPLVAQAARAAQTEITACRAASLDNTITAELAIADAARHKAQAERDPYKRAQWYKRAQDAERRADRAQDAISALDKYARTRYI